MKNHWGDLGRKAGEYLASHISRETCDKLYWDLRTGAALLVIEGAAAGTLRVLTKILIGLADIGKCDRCNEVQIVENAQKFAGQLQRSISRLPDQELCNLYKLLREFGWNGTPVSTNPEIVHKVLGWLLEPVEEEYIVSTQRWAKVS